MRYLLDVNVLVALAWEDHAHHSLASSWFSRKRNTGFSTCPITQAAFVRISSNSRVIPDALPVPIAIDLLEGYTALPEHEFWPDDLTLREAIPPDRRLTGYRQITDMYLIGLAAAHSGMVATFERAMLIAGGGQELVELIE